MSKAEDNRVIVRGNVEATIEVQEEGQIEKQDEEKENVEVAEGQEFEVLPKKIVEQEQQEEILTKAIKTPKRPKVSKIKPSVSSQQEKKNFS